MEHTTVYVLVPEAIYDHGIIGVYATEEEAVAKAKRLWEFTDGHHRFTIHPRRLGVDHFGVFTHREYWRSLEHYQQARRESMEAGPQPESLSEPWVYVAPEPELGNCERCGTEFKWSGITCGAFAPDGSTGLEAIRSCPDLDCRGY